MRSQISNKQQIDNSPIFLLHGWGMNANIWQPMLELLTEQQRARVITLNLPGYAGENSLSNYDLISLAKWLDEKITQPAIVIGWSLGGLVAQQFALDFPEKVLRLGLIGSSPKFMADDSWPGIKPEVLSLFASQLVKSHNKTIERFLAIQALGSDTAKQDIKQIRDLVLAAPEPDAVALSDGLKLLETQDLRAKWNSLRCPIYCLFGRLDSLVPNKAIKLIAELAPELEFDVLTKASHAPFISHPQEFIDWFIKATN